MKKLLIALFSVFLVAGIGVLISLPSVLPSPPISRVVDVAPSPPKIEDPIPLAEVSERVSVVPPLVERKDPLPPPSPVRELQARVLPQAIQQDTLTAGGVYQWTNFSRLQGGLSRLERNYTLLDQVAEARLTDMFQKQYFEHVSPTGEDAGAIAKNLGYRFIAIAENIALGNYGSDEKLVAAWMASPGHRANMMNPRVTEIGVAVGRGVFEGEDTWIGVQIFALPLSACPNVDQALKENIEIMKRAVAELETGLASQKAALDAMPLRGRADYEAYNDSVDEYNMHVAEYNALVVQLKALVAVYNGQVQAFNVCATADSAL